MFIPPVIDAIRKTKFIFIFMSCCSLKQTLNHKNRKTTIHFYFKSKKEMWHFKCMSTVLYLEIDWQHMFPLDFFLKNKSFPVILKLCLESNNLFWIKDLIQPLYLLTECVKSERDFFKKAHNTIFGWEIYFCLYLEGRKWLSVRTVELDWEKQLITHCAIWHSIK